MEDSSIISQEVSILQARFSPPTNVKFHFHQHKGVKLPCCQSAYAVLHGTIVAAASTGGINDVIQYFTSNFNWGCFPCKHYCEALKHANELFCTGTMTIGLESLGMYRSLCPSPPQFDLVVVELILQLSASSVQDNLDNISTAKSTYNHRIINTRWLLNHTCYHNLVGIVDKDKNLTLSDYNGKFLFQQHENNSINKILAIRVSPWLNHHNKMTFLSMDRNSQYPQCLKWNARLLPLHSWTQIAEPSNSGRHYSEHIYRQVNLLASLYKTQYVHNNMHSTTDIPVVEATINRNNPQLLAPHRSSDPLVHTPQPVEAILLITGIYMGTNPCPGVGVARALRVHYNAHTPGTVQLVSLDNCQTSDPVFDAHIPLTDDGAEAAETESLEDSWRVVEREIMQLQQKQSNTKKNTLILYIPCRDREVEVAAAALDSGVHGVGIQGILCPSAAIVESTRKPDIPAVTQGPLSRVFRIPEYYSMHALPAAADATDSTEASSPFSTAALSSMQTSRQQYNEVSLFELRLFADRIGYPVVVKGAVQGATRCGSWPAVRETLHTKKWAQGGYLQKPVRGWEKCIAFAAFAGKLLGCCLMTKGTYTTNGKVWSGDIEPVPADLYKALKEFVSEADWTGGGEIEFIEEVVTHTALCFTHTPHSTATSTTDAGASGVYHPDPMLPSIGGYFPTPTRWVVDFNPRFPAWIFAATYADCNLPALLVRAAVQKWATQLQKKNNTMHNNNASTSGSNGNTDHHLQVYPTASKVHRTSFLRSVIEIPVVHTQHARKLPSFLSEGQERCQKGGKGASQAKLQKGLFPYPILPSVCVQALAQHEGDPQLLMDYHSLYDDLKMLTDAAVEVVSSGQLRHTPQYLVSNKILQNTLRRLRDTLTETAQECGVEVQLCLSVKTQPNTALLKAALQEGYMAECIDLAEVYHSALNAGFPWERIVLTGPAKWWDCKSASERRQDLIEVLPQGPNQSAPAVHLQGIFADSLADLRDIATRLQHKQEHSSVHTSDAMQVDATIVGIRWAPIWNVQSRFGLDCQNAHIVQQAAEVIAALPVQYKLGMHFHHAPSVLGMQQWLGLVQGFVVFCKEFEQLCGRSVTTLDLGGGFEAHYLNSAGGLEQMRRLFQCVSNTWRSSTTLPDCLHIPIVQFELGKCVSESGGGVLTRVLTVRERYEAAEEHSSSEASSVQAVIVDTTIADLSVPNSRAVFWLQPHFSSAEHPSTEQGEELHTAAVPCMGNTQYRCQLLGPGSTEVWGRTCMEWDRLIGSYDLPPGLRAGDLLLITGSGAYDMSMQYDFGDGAPRTQNVLQF